MSPKADKHPISSRKIRMADKALHRRDWEELAKLDPL